MTYWAGSKAVLLPIFGWIDVIPLWEEMASKAHTMKISVTKLTIKTSQYGAPKENRFGLIKLMSLSLIMGVLFLVSIFQVPPSRLFGSGSCKCWSEASTNSKYHLMMGLGCGSIMTSVRKAVWQVVGDPILHDQTQIGTPLSISWTLDYTTLPWTFSKEVVVGALTQNTADLILKTNSPI